jgi:two-component system, cell cycle response regulator CpdR
MTFQEDGRGSPLAQIFDDKEAKAKADNLPLRILLVDDDDAIRAALVRILRRGNGLVEEFNSGHRAIARAKDQEFDLAILDLSMPEMGGEELAGVLLERSPRLRIVFISGESECARGIRIRGMGVQVFGKPWDAAEVLAAVYGERLET